MAMNAATLKGLILSDIQANLKPKFSGLTNTSNLSGLDFDTLWGIIANSIATHVIAHITANATIVGADPQGGSVVSTIS